MLQTAVYAAVFILFALALFLRWILKSTSGKKIDGGPGGDRDFPDVKKMDLFSTPTVYLSLIVPAYNEEDRLPEMMGETIRYLQKRSTLNSSFTWELILVDDGSRDKTAKIAKEFAQKMGVSQNVRVLTGRPNRGKGYTVREGMLNAKGKLLLMVDADGATKISDVERLEDELKAAAKTAKDMGVAVGSRYHIEQETAATAKRTFFRKFISKSFHLLVLTCVKDVRDTQCGFKLCTRKAAQAIFPNMHVDRWCFDVEMLYLAQATKCAVVEVPVNWTEIPGSKVDIVGGSIQMAKDIIRIRLSYSLGIWTVRKF